MLEIKAEKHLRPVMSEKQDDSLDYILRVVH
jgi:hypothetical protein